MSALSRRLDKADIDEIILVSASCIDAVKAYFGRPSKGVNPDEVVAVVRPFKAAC